MTEQEVLEALERDPAFLALSPEERTAIALNMLQAEAAKQPDQQVWQAGGGRTYDPTSPGDIGWTLGEVGGAMGGSLAGTAVAGRVLQAIPHPVPKMVGTAITAAGGMLGAGAGAGAVGAGRAAYRGATGTPDKPITEAARDAAIEGMVGEGLGRAVIGVPRAIAKAVGGTRVVRPDVVAAGQARGMHFTPAEQSEQAIPALIQNRVSRSIVSGDIFQNLAERNQKAVQQWAEDIAEQHFGGVQSPMVGGTKLQQIIRAESIPEYKEMARQLYAELKDLPKIPQVETGKILRELDILDESINAEIAPTAKKLVNVARSTIGVQNPKTGQWIPRSVSFLELHELRSYLNQIGRDHTDVLPDRVGGIAFRIANTQIGQVMEAAAKRAGPEGYQKWKEADKFVRIGHQIFDDAAVVGALRARPEDVVDATFSKRSITEAQRMIAALERSKDPVGAVNLYRQTAMGRLLERATVDGKLDPNKLANAVYGPNGIGADTMEAVFGPAYMKQFDLMLAAAKKAQVVSTRALAGNPSETARSLVAWIEGSAVISLASTALADVFKGELSPHTVMLGGTVASYAITARALAKLLSTQTGVELLRKAMLTSPKSQEAAKLLPRLIAAMGGEMMNSE